MHINAEVHGTLSDDATRAVDGSWVHLPNTCPSPPLVPVPLSSHITCADRNASLIGTPTQLLGGILHVTLLPNTILSPHDNKWRHTSSSTCMQPSTTLNRPAANCT
jgi:hypothetical protein